MTGKQDSFEQMSVSSVAFLLNNTSITSALPNFSTYLTNIQNTNEKIRSTLAQQESNKHIDTNGKKILKMMLIAQAIDLGRKMVAYATNANKSDLLTQINYAESTLKKSSDATLVSIGQVIHDKANGIATDLASYGVTPLMITTLQTCLTSFNDAIPQRRVVKTDGGATTSLLSSLFNTLKTNWAKIDVLVEMVRISQSSFYDEYKHVRTIVQTGIGMLSLKVKTYESETGNILPNVSLSISTVDPKLAGWLEFNKKRLLKKTAARGGAHYKGVPNGNYMIYAKKPGRKDTSAMVNIIAGEFKIVKIFMDKA
jgi:hypothetical protein